MHPALNVFSSGRFYDGRVRTCPNVAASRVGAKPPKGVAWPNASAPLAFVAIEGTDNERRDADRGKAGDGDGASVSNAAERDALVGVVRGLLARSDVAPSDVGVITPYAAQARAVRDALGASPDLGAGAVEVNTVDAYPRPRGETRAPSVVPSRGRRCPFVLALRRAFGLALLCAFEGTTLPLRSGFALCLKRNDAGMPTPRPVPAAARPRRDPSPPRPVPAECCPRGSRGGAATRPRTIHALPTTSRQRSTETVSLGSPPQVPGPRKKHHPRLDGPVERRGPPGLRGRRAPPQRGADARAQGGRRRRRPRDARDGRDVARISGEVCGGWVRRGRGAGVYVNWTVFKG